MSSEHGMNLFASSHNHDNQGKLQTHPTNQVIDLEVSRNALLKLEVLPGTLKIPKQ